MAEFERNENGGRFWNLVKLYLYNFRMEYRINRLRQAIAAQFKFVLEKVMLPIIISITSIYFDMISQFHGKIN